MSDAGGATTLGGDTAGGGGIAVNGTERPIASNKVEGAPVYNRRGERIGSVYPVMVGKCSGQVAHAVPGFGGFLGVGERYYPLPWKALDHDPKLGGYVGRRFPASGSNAPSPARGEAPWADPGYGHSVQRPLRDDAPRMGVWRRPAIRCARR